MIVRSLVPYIQSYQRQGYSKAAIVQYLSAYGYSPSDIADTFDVLTPKKKSFPIVLMIGILIVVLVAGASLLYFLPGVFKPWSSSALNSDALIASIDTASAREISFFAHLKNAPSPQIMRYKIISSDRIVSSGEITIDSERDVRRIQFPVPLPPGSYSLWLESTESPSLERELVFVVPQSLAATPSPTPVSGSTGSANPLCTNGLRDGSEDGVDCGGVCGACNSLDCNSACVDSNHCTRDACQDGVCAFEPIVPCCGNGLCEDFETPSSCDADCVSSDLAPNLTPLEIMERAALTASSDPLAAQASCRTLDDEYEQSLCFDRIARSAGDSSLCGLATHSDIRSSCYMDFAANRGDFSVCDKIENRYLRDSCESLAQLNAV